MEALKNWFGRQEVRKGLFIALLFALCVMTAFFVRTWHYNREAARLALALGDVRPGDASLKDHLRNFLPFQHKNFVPFTIESAMMYGYTLDIASGKGVPSSDRQLVGMEDLTPWSQMNMGLEWFLGYGYRLKSLIFKDGPYTDYETRFESNPGLAHWAAFQIRLWASLTTGFIFLWLIVLGCKWRFALFGGLLHAVALSSIARATGQDLVRGEFCIPLIIGSFLLAHWIYRRGSWWRALLLFISVALAFATWDLCQMLFGCWALFELLRIALGGRVTPERRLAWFAIYMAIAFNALFVPFHKVYMLLQSPLMLVVMPALMLMLFWGFKLNAFWKRLALILLALGVLYGIWLLAVRTPEYDSAYKHFGAAMSAKLKFMNVKPIDPNLLTYDARIMWTPSMHSATWGIACSFFPQGAQLLPIPLPKVVKGLWWTVPFIFELLCGLFLLGMLFGRTRAAIVRGLPRSLLPCLFTVGFIAGFALIVRYHEFAIIFICLSLPLLAEDISGALGLSLRRYSPLALRMFKIAAAIAGGIVVFCILALLLGTRSEAAFNSVGLCMLLLSAIVVAFIIVNLKGEGLRCRIIGWAFSIALAFAFTLEMTASFTRGDRDYKGDIFMRQTASLIQWFRSSGVQGRNIIADFTVGPLLKAYCGMGIAMQPQWGIERIRRPTEIYINTMYYGSEQDLNSFCLQYKADFLLYDKGYVGPLLVDSTRYMAAAIDIPDKSMANMMCRWSDNLRWFYRIDPPPEFKGVSAKFFVFKVISPKDRLDSMRMVIEGERARAASDGILAARLAKAAVWLDPYSDSAKKLYFNLYKRLPVIGLDGVN